MDIITKNITFLDGHKATRAVLLDRVFNKVKPYGWVSKAATALNVVAVGTEIGSTWRQSNLTFGKKAGKTGIIGLGAMITWGAGIATSEAGPVVAIGTAVGVGAFSERVKQWLYQKTGLE